MFALNETPKAIGLLVGGIVFAVFALSKFLLPTVTGAEPPLLKPAVPLIGHVVGLIKDAGTFPNKI
jgi:hypothetical protein